MKQLTSNLSVLRTSVFTILAMLIITGCGGHKASERSENLANESDAEGATALASKKRVLYVDSYNDDLDWVKDITKGILQGFNIKFSTDGSIQKETGKVVLQITHMDTKRYPSEEHGKKVAKTIMQQIEEWKPDLIIASDDNAAIYLIVPYLKNTEIPVLFCGINWDASEYGFPTTNVTGMIEVTLVPELIKILSPYAQGKRITFLAANDNAEQKNVEHFRKNFLPSLTHVLVNTYDEFKQKFIQLQTTTDLLILGSIQSLPGFDARDAVSFTTTHTRIPTGSLEEFLAPYVSVSCAKTGVEQGLWTARTALRILDGEDINSIPIVRNQEARIYLNLRIASRLQMKFSEELMQKSVVVR